MLAREEEKSLRNTPMHLAVLWNKIDVLRVLLEHDRSLGYVVNSDYGTPLLNCAAYGGHAGVVRELLKHCPDAPYSRRDGWTCLHQAVWCDEMKLNKEGYQADPRDETSIYNLHKQAKDKVTNLIRKDIMSLTETYTGNTSLVVILRNESTLSCL